MPAGTIASGSVSSNLVKAYRKMIYKMHLDDLESTQHAVTYEAVRLRTKVSLNSAFEKVKFALLKSDMRMLWHACKQTARSYWNQGRGTQAVPVSAADVVGKVEPTPIDPTKLDHLYGKNDVFRTSFLYIISKASQVFMHTLNTTEVQGAEVMEMAMARPKGQALITVCNHVAALDDPLVLTAIMPKEYHASAEAMRWSLCATDRCFKYKSMIPAFRAAKLLPIQRGGGMRQEGMVAAEHRLQQGDWVHVFPEGTRTRDPNCMGPIRKGVGRLVAACETTPLVVKVLVGQPIPVDDLLHCSKVHHWTDDQLHSAIAERVARQLMMLKAQLKGDAQELASYGSGLVSPLDLYDDADLSWEQKASMWEKLRFKVNHRAWAMQSHVQSWIKTQTQATSDSSTTHGLVLPTAPKSTPVSLASALMSLASSVAIPSAPSMKALTLGPIGASLFVNTEPASPSHVLSNYMSARSAAVAGLVASPWAV
eukprot:gene2724-12597_t